MISLLSQIDRNQLDITNKDQLTSIFKNHNIKTIINCAAYTQVDKAEDEPELAFKINKTSVELISQAAKAHGAKLIQISTDFVFDGDSGQAYSEGDAVNPCSVYGQSKFDGEQVALEVMGEDVTIIRTSWLYSRFKNNYSNESRFSYNS